jgi:hypothetical protein
LVASAVQKAFFRQTQWTASNRRARLFLRHLGCLQPNSFDVCKTYCPEYQLRDGWLSIRVMKPKVERSTSGEVGKCLDHPQGFPAGSDGPLISSRPPLSNGKPAFGQPRWPAQQYSHSFKLFMSSRQVLVVSSQILLTGANLPVQMSISERQANRLNHEIRHQGITSGR